MSMKVVCLFDVCLLGLAPRVLSLAPRPNRVRDFDWIGSTSHESLDGPAWMAVAVGRRVLFIAAGSAE